MQNLLIPDIQSLIEQNPKGIDEYSLLKSLEDHIAFSDIGSEGHLPLFHKHFLIMNALYELQNYYWSNHSRLLEITPLINQLHPINVDINLTNAVQAESRGPSEYYRNWDNFFNTTESDVLQLYKQFWEYMAKDEKKEEAFNTLELDSKADLHTITRRYRELAMHHHPDKGGDKERFIAIRAAYETLRLTVTT